MANIKSQKKRNLLNQEANLVNKAKKSRINSEIRKFKEQLIAKDFASAEQTKNNLFGLIDSARLDNVYHDNTASRKKANLSRELCKAKDAK